MVAQMKRGFSVAVAAFSLSFIPGPSLGAQEPTNIVILKDHALCISENVANYLSLGQDPLFIYSGYCRLGEFDPDPTVVARDTSVNTFSTPTIRLRDGSELSSNELAALLILTRDQIQCLSDKYDDVTSDSEMREVGSRASVEIIRLNFNACNE
jgi:hypothetical protein